MHELKPVRPWYERLRPQWLRSQPLPGEHHAVQRGVQRGVPLQVVLVLPFLLQVTGAVALTGWLSLRHGRQTVEDLVQQLMDRTGAQVEQRLESYLALPVRVNEENQRAIALGLLDKPLPVQRRHFWSQALIYRELGAITWAHVDGRFLGIGRWVEGVGLVSDEIHANRLGYSFTSSLDANGQVLGLVEQGEYTPHEEDWYLATLRANRQVWEWSLEEGQNHDGKSWTYAAISLNQPVYDKNRRLLGVIGSDLMLSSISEWLRQVQPSPTGEIIIFDRQGGLIGSSTPEPVIRNEAGELERLSLETTPDPLLRSLGQAIQGRLGGPRAIRRQQTLHVQIGGKPTFVQVRPWRDRYGLDWVVAIAVPQSDFTARIERNAQQTLGLCGLAFLGATLLGLWTSRKITRSLGQLGQTTQAIAHGDWTQSAKPAQIREFNQLVQAFNHMAEQLRASFITLNYQANHDSLTGLLNRRSFRDLLQAHLEAVPSPSLQLSALLFLDLDYFKLVNDSLGHLIGDQLLLAVCDRLKSCLRETDQMSRFGGDEFVILLRGLSQPDEATAIAQRLIEGLQRPFELDGHEIFIDTSIGMVIGFANQTADTLLRSADAALYRAKATGRGRYELFDHQMHTDVVKRLQVETDLRWGLERQELCLYYQPIVHLPSHTIRGFEALVRWLHPQRGLISPAEFIPVAEETGLVIRLGWWVLEQACGQARSWQILWPHCENLSISVNISSKQFLQPNFLDRIEQILHRTQLPPQCLKLEITESLLMHHEGTVQAKLKRLVSLGIQFSIDDFGTGYSSLSYLHRFPISQIKIDQSFVQNLDKNIRHDVIVETMIELSHRLGMSVVAEGVETPLQLARLQSFGCELIQGFLISKPLDTLAAERLLHLANHPQGLDAIQLLKPSLI